MPVTHVNRKRDTFYLHAGKTKTGKSKYWFAKSTEGDLVESMPEGYEIYENPDAQVFLRKIVPQLVTPAEVAMVEEGLRRYAPGKTASSMSRRITSSSTMRSGFPLIWGVSGSESVNCRSSTSAT